MEEKSNSSNICATSAIPLLINYLRKYFFNSFSLCKISRQRNSVGMSSPRLHGMLWDSYGAAFTFYAGAGFCVLTLIALLTAPRGSVEVVDNLT